MDFSHLFNGIIPNKYRVLPLNLERVTSDVEYQDGGVDFNENSDTTIQEWEYVYKNLTPENANEVDKFFKANWYSRSFTYTDKDGKVHADCFISKGSFKADHQGHKSWKRDRSFRIAKYNVVVPTDFESPTVPTNLSISNESATGFDASFTASTDNVAVTGYNLRLNGGIYTNHIIDVGNDTSPTVSGLTITEGINYTVEVAAYDAAGNQSDWSVSDQFTWSGVDSDATAFIAKVELSDALDTTQENAIYDLVGDLKTLGLWAKLHCIYPFIGGSANAHKWNLKDPQDTNEAFRLTWHGTVTHNANGVTGNGTDGHARPRFNQTDDGATDNESFGVYSRTNSQGGLTEIGVIENYGSQLNLRSNVNKITSRAQTGTLGQTSNSDSRGFFAVSRTQSSQYIVQKDATPTTETISSAGRETRDFFILARNNAGTADNFSNRNIAFAFIGDGLTSTELGNLNTAITDFQTSLGRNV